MSRDIKYVVERLVYTAWHLNGVYNQEALWKLIARGVIGSSRGLWDGACTSPILCAELEACLVCL